MTDPFACPGQTSSREDDIAWTADPSMTDENNRVRGKTRGSTVFVVGRPCESVVDLIIGLALQKRSITQTDGIVISNKSYELSIILAVATNISDRLQSCNIKRVGAGSMANLALPARVQLWHDVFGEFWNEACCRIAAYHVGGATTWSGV